MAEIIQLKDGTQSEDWLPVTNTSAIYDNDGNRLDNTLNQLNENLTKHDFGTKISLLSYNSSSNQYTCPCDGYIQWGLHGSDYQKYIAIKINGVLEVQMNGTGGWQFNTFFIKKGMKVHMSQNDGSSEYFFNFFPLV